jgi:hypothetical protein
MVPFPLKEHTGTLFPQYAYYVPNDMLKESMRSFTLTGIGSAGLFLLLTLSSCEERTGTHENAPAIDSNGISSTGTMNLEGEIISVPSPVQISMMIQRARIPFDRELLNPLTNKDQYLTEYDKAMALGVYGADLAYAANYEAGQLTGDYFSAVGKLSADLQIIDHIDPKLISALNNNIGNRDSLLRLNAQFFKAGDSYLKEVKRSDLAGLILFGGWVEALHISVKAGKSSEDIRARIGEQNNAAVSLRNLIGKLTDPSMKEIQDQMAAVTRLFEAMRVNYTYQKPINDAKEKVTYLRSKTTVEITPEQLAELETETVKLRNLIIQ